MSENYSNKTALHSGIIVTGPESEEIKVKRVFCLSLAKRVDAEFEVIRKVSQHTRRNNNKAKGSQFWRAFQDFLNTLKFLQLSLSETKSYEKFICPL